MEYQLRIYDMKPGALDEFVEYFPRVVELRRRVGFTIEGAWVEREANRFVWIAGYGGDDGFRAAERRYDVEMLSDDFNVDFQLIGERLSALPTTEGQPRFGFYQSNASGNITLSRNLPGMVVPRYGSSCPLWILYRAQQTPHAVQRQHVQMPSGEGFVFVARAANTSAIGFAQARHYLTDMCVLSDDDARHTVYAPDRVTAFEPVGLSCRTCPRVKCKHRVVDPLTG